MNRHRSNSEDVPNLGFDDLGDRRGHYESPRRTRSDRASGRAGRDSR
jgi:hypothetical protein